MKTYKTENLYLATCGSKCILIKADKNFDDSKKYNWIMKDAKTNALLDPRNVDNIASISVANKFFNIENEVTDTKIDEIIATINTKAFADMYFAFAQKRKDIRKEIAKLHSVEQNLSL